MYLENRKKKNFFLKNRIKKKILVYIEQQQGSWQVK